MGYIASLALTLIHAPPHQKKIRKREEGIIWSSVPKGHLRATVNRSPESIAQGSHADGGRVREQTLQTLISMETEESVGMGNECHVLGCPVPHLCAW